MKIAAHVIAGNSGELLRGCIAHHRALGVNAFVVQHLRSSDNTPDIVRELERECDDVAAVFTPRHELNDPLVAIRTFRKMREQTRADWILQLDADERWFVEGKTLTELLEQEPDSTTSVVAPRFNIVFPTPEASLSVSNAAPLELAGLPLAMHPCVLAPEDRFLPDCVPWVISRIAPKCCMRARAGLEFTVGGHQAKEPESGCVVPGKQRSDLLVAQLAFTELALFERRAQTLWEWVQELEPPKNPNLGWHWFRFARLHAQGPAAVEAEWARQFMSAEAARQLLGWEVIVPGEQAFAVLRESMAAP